MSSQVVENLTRENLSDLLHPHQTTSDADGLDQSTEQRRSPHWLAAGLIEYWPADENWSQPWQGKCRDISMGGFGMSSDHYLEHGSNIGVALHFGDKCYHGKAVVRYCQRVRDQFMTGAEFLFDS